MQNHLPAFFEGNQFVIDQKVKLIRLSNEYTVYNEEGTQIGKVQQRIKGIHKFFMFLLSKKMFPFHLYVLDNEGNELSSLHRSWTFWLSKIEIHNANGEVIGYLKQKFAFLKPKFEISDHQQNYVGNITGDWKAWDFKIKDKNENDIGEINKKWAGAVKEFFTSSDKYRVSIIPSVTEDANKIVLITTALAIDMLMKENK
jgi:uncharacterized protein YxjI